MKKTYLLTLLALLFSVLIRAQTSPVSEVEIKEYFNYQTLDKVFETLNTKYKLNIVYNAADVKNTRFSYYFNGTKPEQAIKIILRDTKLAYVKNDDGGFAIFDKGTQVAKEEAEKKTKFVGNPTRNNFTLTGIIKEKNTGEPLPFVSVIVSGTAKGTTTNVDGRFTLLNIPSDTTGLEISYIGYKNTLFYLTPKTVITDLLIELETQSEILEEVTVTADRQELMRAAEKVSMLKISPAKIQALPSVGEKDIFRAFQLMPGVSAANENSSGLYVRGGTPDQTLVLYDGFTVYHVEHLFGFFSAFNPNAIKDVQLYKGGFEPKFGGRVSGVAEITAKEGNNKQFNAGIDLGFISTNAFIEVPINDQITTFLAARRSYQTGFYNAIFKKYSGSIIQTGNGRRNFFNSTPSSYFYDLNGKFTYKPTKKDVFTLSIYNGTDNLDNSPKINVTNFGFVTTTARPNFNINITDLTNWGNAGGSFKWSHQFNSKFYINTLLSYSNYYSDRNRSAQRTITDSTGNARTFNDGTFENNNLNDYSAKTDAEYKITDNNKLEFGIGVTYNTIKYNYAQNDTTTLIDRNTNGSTTIFYIQDKWAPFANAEIIGGVRTTYFGPTSKFYSEPRISFNYKLTDKLKLKAAYGIYNQFVKQVVREDIQSGSRDFWVLADNAKLPVASSTHYIAGLSYETKDWIFDAEGYYKNLTGLTQYSLRFQPSRQVINYSENFFQGTGYVRGIDFLLQKKYGALNGWISYTLAEVINNFPVYGVNNFYADNDVRHELKVVGIYKYKNWDFSATWIFASGRPYTSPEGGYQTTLLDGSVQQYINVSDKNAIRLPEYHRMDIAATLNWKSGKGAARALSLSIFNVYNRSNVWYKQYIVQSGNVVENNVNYLGITPNLSLIWRLR